MSVVAHLCFYSLLSFFDLILKLKLDGLENTVRVQRKLNLPAVFGVDEIKALLHAADGSNRLCPQIIYDTGLRIGEFVSLRVKNINFSNGLIQVVNGKGGKSRNVPLAHKLKECVLIHLQNIKECHEKDLAAGFGGVDLPCPSGKPA